MELEILDMPFGERPNLYVPDVEIYKFLGEEGIRKMVNDHYDLMIKSPIKHLFPTTKEGLDEAKHNSADFFVQRLGGPEYFNQRRGSPMLMKRHAPFQINAAGRKVWLECYREVLVKVDAPEHLVMAFWNYIHEFSNWMVNVQD